MRIVAGKHRGTSLATPQTQATRPSSDRLRETLFNVLAHGCGDPVPGARVLDLFAGTGALGLEAMSRGAAFCLFVETGAEARGLIRSNVERMQLTGATKIWRRDATDLGPSGTMGAFDMAFLDPPYRQGLGERALASLMKGGWLKAGALCVLEEAADVPVAVPAEFEEIDSREIGIAQLKILKVME